CVEVERPWLVKTRRLAPPADPSPVFIGEVHAAFNRHVVRNNTRPSGGRGHRGASVGCDLARRVLIIARRRGTFRCGLGGGSLLGQGRRGSSCAGSIRFDVALLDFLCDEPFILSFGRVLAAESLLLCLADSVDTSEVNCAGHTLELDRPELLRRA